MREYRSRLVHSWSVRCVSKLLRPSSRQTRMVTEMYEKLVNALRCYAKDEECYHCEYFSEAGCDIDRMLFDAA